MKAPRPVPTEDADELAEIEAMIARLGEMRQRTQDRALQGAYQAALDRLDALAYRLGNDGGRRVLGLPAKAPASAPKPVGEAPQRALPLGPVVIARKPRRR